MSKVNSRGFIDDGVDFCNPCRRQDHTLKRVEVQLRSLFGELERLVARAGQIDSGLFRRLAGRSESKSLAGRIVGIQRRVEHLVSEAEAADAARARCCGSLGGDIRSKVESHLHRLGIR